MREYRVVKARIFLIILKDGQATSCTCRRVRPRNRLHVARRALKGPVFKTKATLVMMN